MRPWKRGSAARGNEIFVPMIAPSEIALARRTDYARLRGLVPQRANTLSWEVLPPLTMAPRAVSWRLPFSARFPAGSGCTPR